MRREVPIFQVHNLDQWLKTNARLRTMDLLTGVKIPHNKGRHYPFRKSQLDSQMFGMAGLTGLWTRYRLKFGL